MVETYFQNSTPCTTTHNHAPLPGIGAAGAPNFYTDVPRLTSSAHRHSLAARNFPGDKDYCSTDCWGVSHTVNLRRLVLPAPRARPSHPWGARN